MPAGQSPCPYCLKIDCVWTLSVLSGQAGADVHTSCGHSVSADNLLGKSRWHLEAALRAVHASRPAPAQDGPKAGDRPR